MVSRRFALRALAPWVALVVLTAAAPATATLYKWTDANGRVVYSDQPPPGDVKSEIVRPAPPPSNPSAAKDIANRDAELKQRQAQRAEQEKKADKARVDAAKKEDFCAQARGQLKALETDLPIYRVNENGEPVYIDDAQRKQNRERTQQLIRERCAAS